MLKLGETIRLRRFQARRAVSAMLDCSQDTTDLTPGIKTATGLVIVDPAGRAAGGGKLRSTVGQTECLWSSPRSIP